ncbi:MAG TPA: hypothetical protein VI258_01340 [Rhodanobacteraceae bacterium]
MSEAGAKQRFVAALLAVLWAIGTLRALLVAMHAPLYAYANSYDQTRYTTCFHFYPDRPADVEPQLHSPEAPYAKFRFIETRDPMCYWSSELAFTGATALIWSAGEAAGDTTHDVRWVAALRWLALLGISIALSRAWLRRGNARAAIANAALVPLLFADPGNTLYLSTFYAEWTALLAAYALFALVLLWRGEPRSRARFAMLALVAFALATSKLQHMLLPLGLGVVLLVLDRWRLRQTSWRAGAVVVGALFGLYFQFVQTTREGPMMDAIRQYNTADVVFTGVLPFADDPRALLAEVGIDPGCAIYRGKRAWELPDLPERACRGLVNFTRTRELGVLLRHPSMAAALVAHGIVALDPWIAENIGHVEGGAFQKLPASIPSVGRLLQASAAVRYGVLALPFAGLLILFVRPGPRKGSAALEATALVVVTMIGTLAVTLLGDGLADTAKQGHLVVNAALAWLAVGLMMRIPANRTTVRTADAPGDASLPPR